jgi:hypothetical protein
VIAVPAAGTAIDIERGVQAIFTVDPAGGNVRTFDYWTFAARTANAWVEPLTEAPPRGIHRHYCRLAVVTFPGTVLDCRTLWPPLPAAAEPRPDEIAVRRVKRVDVRDEPLLNDSSVPVRSLAGGIRVSLDGTIDPESVVKKPTCTVTIELPFPFNRADQEVWGEPIIAFSPLVLNANVNAQENVIIWTPERDTAEWMVGRLFQRMRDLNRRADRLLAHLTLQGNFIWGMEGADNPRLLHLDGEIFGRPRDGRTDVVLPSGDRNRGGDFKMWFWLVPDQG